MIRENLVEIVAAILVAVWVLGLLTSNIAGGAIHLLLIVAVAMLLIQRHTRARARFLSKVNPAGILAIVTGRSRRERADPRTG